MTGMIIAMLFGVLIFLILMSAFFSSSETAMMSVNPYRLRYLAEHKKLKAAKRVKRLLERPDRLLGMILIGNTFANIIASSIATLLAVQLIGETGIAVATVLLTLVILVFAEVAPKTMAALYPEKVAFGFSLPLVLLLKLSYPLVWLINTIANGILKLFQVSVGKKVPEHLSLDEFRAIIYEAGGKMPAKNQRMLLSVLELQEVSIESIMVPRHDVVGIDINDDLEDIKQSLRSIQHTRLPLYRGHGDDIIGMLHARTLLKLFMQENFTKQDIIEHAAPVLFAVEGTSLNQQLLNFQQEKKRSAVVIDEYGDIQGLITLEDILEEIVGEFTTDYATDKQDPALQADGSYIIDGSLSLRKLNRQYGWQFSTKGPKTLSGLIIERLQAIPNPGTGLRIDGYPVEVIKVQDNLVKIARVYPNLRQQTVA